VLTQAEATHLRDFEEGLLSIELFEGHRELDREAAAVVRRRRKISLRNPGGSVLCAGCEAVKCHHGVNNSILAADGGAVAACGASRKAVRRARWCFMGRE
jgi:hypothetical protein